VRARVFFELMSGILHLVVVVVVVVVSDYIVQYLACKGSARRGEAPHHKLKEEGPR
jgi:hypothetical protein